MMKNRVIKVDKEDNNFQRFEVLKRNRNKRYKYQEFFVEGVRNINEAIKNKWQVKHFLYSSESQLSKWAKEILMEIKAESIYDLNNQLMSKLSSKENTSELIALIAAKPDDVKRIKLKTSPLVVVFDRPSNKGNLGTIIRSCDAMGCDGLVITGHAVDLYDPDTITSTMGSFFNLPTIRMASNMEMLSWIEYLKGMYPNLKVIGTSSNGNLRIDQCNFNKPTILLIGNETRGLSRKYIDMSDELVQIPIGGSASSLNVACAASILLYEISRQRGFENI